jgi:tetratricopeptide (TPR) repeat protein
MFRRLGLHPGWDINVAAAASIAAQPTDQTQALLTELADAHLITQHAPGRYSLHDLLRTFAAELAEANDSELDRRAATHRVLDHYLHTAYAATLLLRPTRDPITLPPPAPGVTPQPLADCDGALTWFQAEHSVLLATMGRPPDGFDRHTWQLAWSLLSYLSTRGHWRDNELVQRAGLRAADRLGDPTAQAFTHRCLANVYLKLGRPADAQPHNEMSLHLFEQAGDVVETANSHSNLGTAVGDQGDTLRALTHAESAYHAHQSVGNAPGQAHAANAIGWYHGRLGDHRTGLPYCQEALDIFLDIGDLDASAMTWDSLGALHFGIGDYEQGEQCYRQTINLYRRLGDRYHEANTYATLIHAHTQTGDYDAAHRARQEAIAILDQLEPAAASQIRARLEPTLAVT